MLPAELTTNPNVPVWVTVFVAIATLVFGGGGVAALMKAHWDRQAGIEAHEVDEDDAITRHWEALSKAQIEVLLNPLRERLTEVEQTVKRLETELDASRKKYWTAIPFIRVLLAMLHRHVPDVALPPIPASIAEDI